jgi:hypothetical protein
LFQLISDKPSLIAFSRHDAYSLAGVVPAVGKNIAMAFRSQLCGRIPNCPHPIGQRTNVDGRYDFQLSPSGNVNPASADFLPSRRMTAKRPQTH